MRQLWPVIVSALLLRLLAASFVGTQIGDAHNYLVIAGNIAAGHGMVIDDPKVMANLRAFYPPLYPLLLTSISLSGTPSPYALAISSFAIDLGVAAAILWLCRLVDQRKAGPLAAAAFLLWPSRILLSGFAHKEGLIALLVVCIAALIIECSRRKIFAVPLGAAAAALALTQPGLLFLPALFGLALAPRFDRRWFVTMSAAAAVAVIVMLPWWIRNYLIFDQFIPLTSSSGFGLWVGANPSGTGSWMQSPPHLLIGGELAANAHAWNEAIGWIVADPIRFVLHSLGKVATAFITDAGVSAVFSSNPTLPVHLTAMVIATLLVLLYGSAAVGMAIERSTVTRLILACLANMLLFQMWFEFGSRHRSFATPFLMIAAMIPFLKFREQLRLIRVPRAAALTSNR